MKRRVRVSRNRSEVEGRGVKTNNTSGLKGRKLCLGHNSGEQECPSREGTVAGGTQSMAVGACGKGYSCFCRSQSKGNSARDRAGLILSDPSSSLSFPLAKPHLLGSHSFIKQCWSRMFKHRSLPLSNSNKRCEITDFLSTVDTRRILEKHVKPLNK